MRIKYYILCLIDSFELTLIRIFFLSYSDFNNIDIIMHWFCTLFNNLSEKYHLIFLS